MPIGTIQFTANIAGIAMSSNISRSATGQEGHIVELPAAQAGSLTTRTDDDTGEVTLAEGHDVVTGKVNVFWDGGVRYDVDGVKTVNVIAIDAGSGDDLPDADTAITIANEVDIDIAFDADNLKQIGILSNKHAHVFLDADAVGSKAVELTAGEIFEWSSLTNDTVPITGDLTKAAAANADSTGVAELKMGVLFGSI